jgi:ketosteroid isomerase-like protein
MAQDKDQEIIALETQFWNAIQAKDVPGATRLMGEACIVTGAQGVGQIDKPTFAKMMETGTWVLREYSFSDIKVIRATDDVAIIGYKVHEKLTVEGKPLTLDAADASTWVRRNGSWTCALHTESVLGDPFGRDRTAGPK